MAAGENLDKDLFDEVLALERRQIELEYIAAKEKLDIYDHFTLQLYLLMLPHEGTFVQHDGSFCKQYAAIKERLKQQRSNLETTYKRNIDQHSRLNVPLTSLQKENNTEYDYNYIFSLLTQDLAAHAENKMFNGHKTQSDGNSCQLSLNFTPFRPDQEWPSDAPPGLGLPVKSKSHSLIDTVQQSRPDPRPLSPVDFNPTPAFIGLLSDTMGGASISNHAADVDVVNMVRDFMKQPPGGIAPIGHERKTVSPFNIPAFSGVGVMNWGNDLSESTEDQFLARHFAEQVEPQQSHHQRPTFAQQASKRSDSSSRSCDSTGKVTPEPQLPKFNGDGDAAIKPKSGQKKSKSSKHGKAAEKARTRGDEPDEVELPSEDFVNYWQCAPEPIRTRPEPVRNSQSTRSAAAPDEYEFEDEENHLTNHIQPTIAVEDGEWEKTKPRKKKALTKPAPKPAEWNQAVSHVSEKLGLTRQEAVEAIKGIRNETGELDLTDLADGTLLQRAAAYKAAAKAKIQLKNKATFDIPEEKFREWTYKTQECLEYQATGICKQEGKCKFAHGKHELRSRRKVKLCDQWKQFGYCPNKERCRMAHGEEEYGQEVKI